MGNCCHMNSDSEKELNTYKERHKATEDKFEYKQNKEIKDSIEKKDTFNPAANPHSNHQIDEEDGKSPAAFG